jgi:hypothetical protein
VLRLHQLLHDGRVALGADVVRVRRLLRRDDAATIREEVREDVAVRQPESSVWMWNTLPWCRTLVL